MAFPIAMPRQGNTVESCVIQEWRKKKGDLVKQGDVLFSYETDKASFEFESPHEGTLLEIFFEKDEDVPVLTNVAVIGNVGESVNEFRPSGSGENSSVQAAETKTIPSVEPVSTPSVTASESVVQPQVSGMISPRARKLAETTGVAVSGVLGTGPKGRIIERDIQSAIESGQKFTYGALGNSSEVSKDQRGTGIGGRVTIEDLKVQPSVSISQQASVSPSNVDKFTEVKMSNMRKIIGSRMMESLQQAAQLTLHTSACAEELLAYRAKVKACRESLGIADITITDLIAYAVNQTLVKFPDVNSLYMDDKLYQYENVHLAMAVDTPRGLMVPVVKFANTLSLNQLAVQLKSAAKQCIDGSINPDQLSGGTFTISNLGAFGIEMFTPVLNRPQAALLGVNTIQGKPVVSKNGTLEMKNYIGLSLTIDHRVLDGAQAARFLKALVAAIENISITISL